MAEQISARGVCATAIVVVNGDLVLEFVKLS